MEKVSLYIAGKKVDLDEQSFILYNYATRDLTNPTIVKNSFSKQITLKGTSVNNEIFGHFFKSDRLTKLDNNFTGVYFNPLQKMPFAIYDEKSHLIESGYVKLNSVTKENDNISYAITLYGELGLFLYNLSYGEDGSKRTLASLDFGIGSFAFPIIKESVVAAWNNLQQSSRDMQSLWDFVNFIPCYNGIPEKFSANKAYLPNSNTLVDLSRNYTEWETRELRSKHQNCGLSIKGIFHGIKNWSEKNGYKLNLDESFFNANNPHYERLWYLLSQITYGRETAVQLAEGVMTTASSLCIEEVTNGHSIPFSMGNVRTDLNGYIDLSSFDKEAFLDAEIVLGLNPQLEGYISHYNERKREWNGALIGVQVQVTIDREIVNSSDVFIWGNTDDKDERLNNLLPYFNYDKYVFVGNNAMNSAAAKIKGYVRGSSQVRISVNTIMVTNDNNTGNTIVFLYPNEESDGVPLPIWEGELSMASYEGKITLNLPSEVEAGSVVSKGTILANTPTPADFLLSYCKQYGLQIQVQNNQVSIVTRNNFYSGEVIDATPLIDKGSIQITPIPFEKRRSRLDLGHYDNFYEKKYQQVMSKSYGAMVVDTGYQFNNEEENLFSTSVFKGGVSVRESGFAYRNYKDSSGNIINPALVMGYTENGEFIQPLYTQIENVNGGVDLTSKLCSYSYDGDNKKGLKTDGILVFFNGMKESQIDYYVSDQFKEENAWVLFNKASEHARKVTSLPEFSRYWSENGSVKYSLDFGTPSEIYDNTITLTSESSIYERYWKSILQDQYDVDERVMKCKANLFGMQVNHDLLRKFFYYDNAIWVLNKISNHSITTKDLTECEFVKVKDIKNYTEGQKL